MMKTSLWPAAACLLALSSLAQALEIGKKPDTPQIPNSPYLVHDGTRPTPPAVGTQRAVIAKPPAEAEILFDGTSLDAWKQKDQFVIKDGILVAAGGASLSGE